MYMSASIRYIHTWSYKQTDKCTVVHLCVCSAGTGIPAAPRVLKTSPFNKGCFCYPRFGLGFCLWQPCPIILESCIEVMIIELHIYLTGWMLAKNGMSGEASAKHKQLMVSLDAPSHSRSSWRCMDSEPYGWYSRVASIAIEELLILKGCRRKVVAIYAMLDGLKAFVAHT